jgi:hypothetical protein
MATVVPAQSALPILPASGRVTLVYLLAASHSGSTLTALLLGSHSKLATAGELKMTSIGDLSRYRCSCRELITECRFWRSIRAEMAKRGHEDFDIDRAGTDTRTGASSYVKRLLAPLHRGVLLEAVRDAGLFLSPVWRREVTNIQKRNSALIGSLAAVTGREYLVDSSKIGIRLKYLLRNRDFDVKIVRLVRDGRAVALTYMDPVRFADAKDPSLRAGGMGGTRDREKLSLEAAAREWLRSNEEQEHVLARVDRASQATLRYEDVCADPDRELSKVFDMLGVQPENVSTRFRRAEQHVIGNGMRLDDSTEIKLDERWKQAFTAEQLRRFNAIAGAMNRKLGYA